MTASRAPVTLSHRASISDAVLAQNVGDEVVLLDLAGEQYFGLDSVGTRIWALLPESDSLEKVLDRLCDEFDAPRERIEADLLALIAALCEAGLVTVV